MYFENLAVFKKMLPVLQDIEAAGKKLQARDHLLLHPDTVNLKVCLKTNFSFCVCFKTIVDALFLIFKDILKSVSQSSFGFTGEYPSDLQTNWRVTPE